MNKLVQTIELVRSKLDGLRRQPLKETPTRTIIIDPILEAMGWDIRDPEEVELECPTVDGKSVDYALKINRKTVLLVEAKALDDMLDDVKAITQICGYAANDGIVWCVLTNGVKWKVYRSVEKCPAPEKLMFEASLDPRDSEGSTLEQVSQQLWRLSRDEMAKGTLDALGEQTFTDGKVRKALDALMRNPPRPLLNLIRRTSGDTSLIPRKISESLGRIWGFSGPVKSEGGESATDIQSVRHLAAVKAAKTRRQKGAGNYGEDHHLAGKPQEVVELYRAIDRLCLSMRPGGVERLFMAKAINFNCGSGSRACFCAVHILQSGLRVWLKLKYADLTNPPSFARDVSAIGHWGSGSLELSISNPAQLEEAAPLIRASFDTVARKG